MSFITIQCRLVADEAIRRNLWELMANKNTPLVNELLKQVTQHDDFETWQSWGSVPSSTIKALCEPLKALYPAQPARFYASAILMVTYTYESWLALQQSRRRRLNGKQRWLDVVKSDAELLELSGSTLEAMRHRAQEILSQLTVELGTQPAPTEKKQSQKHKQSQSDKNTSLMARLFATYDATDDILSQCAIAHLIKNGCKISETEEDTEKFSYRIHRQQKAIEQLEAQLQARLPKGRDLPGEEFLQTLAIATQQISESVIQAQEWQAKLLTRPASLPYPIVYGSATDIRWGKTSKDRIAVSFNGIDKYLKEADPEIQEWFKTHKEYPFRLYCDQRQLPFFQCFLADWQTYQANKETYPAGLLTLSSATLAWQEGTGNGEPWEVNHLAFYCTFDTRLMSAEGTLEIQQEKSDKALKNLTHKNPDPRNYSTLNRLKNVPDRPSRKPYAGNPDILVGLSIGLADPVTAAVVNGRTGAVLTYRSPRVLLGDRHRLLNRHRQQQQQNTLQRHKNQKQGLTYQPSESELGQYVDRLLAESIIQLAQTYQAGSIVIPSLTHLRELLESEITAKAERKSSAVEVQDKYAKDYRMAIHRWSYNRLIDAIQSKAQQFGITIESGFQPIQGDPQQQAEDVAIAAYHSRAIATK